VDRIRPTQVYHAAGRVKPLALSLTQLRLRDTEKVGLIAVEKQSWRLLFKHDPSTGATAYADAASSFGTA